MKILTIKSKKYGIFNIKLDNEDYEKLKQFRTMKWCPRVCKDRHNLVYFQKRMSNDTLIELHRFLMDFPDGIVDHINGDTLDNRRCNLQIITNAANIRKGKIRTTNTSGYSGIWKDKISGKWVAEIKVNYKKIQLGRSFDIDEVIKLRKEAEDKYRNI